MKLMRLAFRLSIVANIVLIVWALSQRKQIREMEAEEETEIAMLDSMISDVSEANEDLRIQNLRSTAFHDQIDAYLEEQTGYAS